MMYINFFVSDCNNGKTNWTSNVKNLNFGFNNLWYDQNDINVTYETLKISFINTRISQYKL